MTPCFIFFSTDKDSALSNTIRKLGDGKISHAGVLFYSSHFGQWQILDATESGFTIRSYDQFKKQGNVIIRLYDFADVDLFAGVLANKDLIGVPYDWSGLAGRLVQKGLWALIKRQFKKDPFNNPNKFYCSEILAAKILPAAGINLHLGNRFNMDPYQLANYVAAHPRARLRNPDHVAV